MRTDFYREYDAIEDRHWWFLARRRIVLRLLEERLGESEVRTRRLLDLGCGTGALTRHLGRFGDVLGADVEPMAVEAARRRGVAALRLPFAPPYPFDEGSFDVVCAFDVAEHIQDDAAFLREIRRLLVPGGLVAITVPAFRFLWGPQDEVSEHVRRYRRADLRTRLEAAGFEPERLTYFNTLLFPPIAALRVLRRVRRRRPAGSDADAPASDCQMTKAGGVADGVLRTVFAAEAPLVARHDLPFGVSLFALATRR